MNNTELNASDLNGAEYNWHNAVLSNGIGLTATFTASMIVGAVLMGGCMTTPDASGRIAVTLKGGVTAPSTSVGGKLFMTANLQGGVSVDADCSSEYPMSFDPALKDGIKVPYSVGGQLITNAMLQTPQLGKHTTVGGTMRVNTAVNGGVSCTAYVGGGIRGSTVLVSDGVKCTTLVGSNPMKLGMALTGGCMSNTTVGGKTQWPAYLRGGILSTWELGKEIDCEARLQDGMIVVNSVGGGLLISPVGNGGLESSWTFYANQQLSPAANGGIGKDQTISAGLKVSPRIPGGVYCTAAVSGKGITASQVLRGGLYSSSPLLDGQLKAEAKLQGGIASSAVLHGDIVQGFQDPQLNTWALEIRSATVLLEVQHPTSDI